MPERHNSTVQIIRVVRYYSYISTYVLVLTHGAERNTRVLMYADIAAGNAYARNKTPYMTPFAHWVSSLNFNGLF